MFLAKRNYSVYIVIAVLLCGSKVFAVVEFEPGVGAGLRYTDNARLTPDDEAVDDLVVTAHVGARVSDNEGPLQYGATASLDEQHYTKDSYDDQRYLNLAGQADWAMVKDRFNWFLSDYFSQKSVVSINSITPDNTQDSNVFTFGANMWLPVSARQSFSLVPTFSQYYYEVLVTDNKQYSLAGNWNYQVSRLTSVGLNLSARKINYTEKNLLGLSIEGTTFTTLGFTFNGQRLRSSFTGSIGTTNVVRDNGDETSGFSGFLSWFTDMSSRSTFETLLSTDLTDTSSTSGALSAEGDPLAGGDVQITSDVVRNSIINLAYRRKDASLNTQISARYHKLEYSENPLDRLVRSFGVDMSYPLTQLLSSGIFIRYDYTDQLDTDRLDEGYIVGSHLGYKFSRKLRGLFDIKYRKKESTYVRENYDEFRVFASLVYGFGNVLQ